MYEEVMERKIHYVLEDEGKRRIKKWEKVEKKGQISIL